MQDAGPAENVSTAGYLGCSGWVEAYWARWHFMATDALEQRQHNITAFRTDSGPGRSKAPYHSSPNWLTEDMGEKALSTKERLLLVGLKEKGPHLVD